MIIFVRAHVDGGAMLELVFKWGPPIVGVMTQLVKAFDDRSTLPERVRRILYKEFLTGQEELDRAKAAEEDIRKVAIEQDEEKFAACWSIDASALSTP